MKRTLTATIDAGTFESFTAWVKGHGYRRGRIVAAALRMAQDLPPNVRQAYVEAGGKAISGQAPARSPVSTGPRLPDGWKLWPEMPTGGGPGDGIDNRPTPVSTGGQIGVGGAVLDGGGRGTVGPNNENLDKSGVA